MPKRDEMMSTISNFRSSDIGAIQGPPSSMRRPIKMRTSEPYVRRSQIIQVGLPLSAGLAPKEIIREVYEAVLAGIVQDRLNLEPISGVILEEGDELLPGFQHLRFNGRLPEHPVKSFFADAGTGAIESHEISGSLRDRISFDFYRE
jgi:hypothetical protein